MKKLVVITIAVALIGVMSVGAYAHYRGFDDSRSGGMMYGRRGNMIYGRREAMNSRPGWMQGRGPGGRWSSTPDTCVCGAYGSQNTMRPGWKGWNRPGTTQEMITEDKAKEAAETFVAKYLSGYTVEKVEKDNWRPLYVVTLKGENDAELQILVHGFDGQVMHMFPKPAEQPAE